MRDKTFIKRLITEINIFNQYIDEETLTYRIKNKLEKIEIAFMQSINTNIENAKLSKVEKEHLFKSINV